MRHGVIVYRDMIIGAIGLADGDAQAQELVTLNGYLDPKFVVSNASKLVSYVPGRWWYAMQNLVILSKVLR